MLPNGGMPFSSTPGPFRSSTRSRYSGDTTICGATEYMPLKA